MKFCLSVGSGEGLLYGLDWTISDHGETKVVPAFTSRVHESGIRFLCSNHRYLVTGDINGQLQLFDMERRIGLGRVNIPEGCPSSLTLYGKHLFCGTENGSILVYECGAWKHLQTLNPSDSKINAFKVHPMGTMGISVSKDKTLALWCLSSGKPVHKTTLASEPLDIVFSPLGTRYAILYASSQIQVYDIHMGRLLATLDPKTKVNTVLFLNETLLIYGGDSKRIHVQNLEQGTNNHFPCNGEFRLKVLLSVCEDTVLSISSDGVATIWKWDSNVLCPIKEYNIGVRVLVAVQSPGTKSL